MFENITKGVWSIDEDESKVNKYGVTETSLRVVSDEDGISFNDVICYDPDGSTENAEFIAYCFNLQQKYDISKLEEAVSLLEAGFEMYSRLVRETESERKLHRKKVHKLLTKIKK